MKQVLVCANCQEIVSESLIAIFSTEEVISKLKIGLSYDIVERGHCLKSSISIMELRYNHLKEKVRNSEDRILGNWLKAAKLRLTRIGYSDQQVIDLNWLDAMEAAITGETGNELAPKAYLLHFTPQDWMT